MKRLFFVILILAFLIVGGYAGLAWFLTKPAPPMETGQTITISQGQITAGIDRNDPSVEVFNGIPFAAPPVGDLRWAAPQDPNGWDDVKDGRDFGPECMQSRKGSAEFLAAIVKGMGLGWVEQQAAAISVRHAKPPVESEDCLYLNVRTNNAGGSDLQPVMVWFHGGSHQTGSGSTDIYQSNNLVQHDVVLVTINYRLGPFGYMAHPAISAADPRGVSGNYGLQDQIKSLEWVRDNIAAFGGDPDNVTIFGESAGAQSVTEVMSSPLATGLFHKAILQSGASTYNSNSLDAAIPGRKTMHDAGAEFMAGLVNGEATPEKLREVPADDIIAHLEKNPQMVGYMQPTVDGVVIPRLMGEMIGNGGIINVPILAGYNADEATLFYPNMQTPTVLKSPFPTEFEARMAALDEVYGPQCAAILKAEYRLDNPETYEQGAMDMLGDDLFGVHMRHLARANVATENPAYLYFFARTPPSENQTLGAFHAAELFFVFDSHSPFLPLSEDDKKLTAAMGQYWTNFAKTGDPNGAALPQWPTYDAQTDRWMTFNPKLEVRPNVRKAKLDVMEATLIERVAMASPIVTPQGAQAPEPDVPEEIVALTEEVVTGIVGFVEDASDKMQPAHDNADGTSGDEQSLANPLEP